jgi:hypothetical protein
MTNEITKGQFISGFNQSQQVELSQCWIQLADSSKLGTAVRYSVKYQVQHSPGYSEDSPGITSCCLFK